MLLKRNSPVGQNLNVERPSYEMIQILGVSILANTTVGELLKKTDYTNFKEQNRNQLTIGLF